MEINRERFLTAAVLAGMVSLGGCGDSDEEATMAEDPAMTSGAELEAEPMEEDYEAAELDVEEEEMEPMEPVEEEPEAAPTFE